MEPARRVLSNTSTRSYLEKELILSLDNEGPMIGPNLETMDTHHQEDRDTIVEKTQNFWWKMSQDKTLDPKQLPPIKKNIILLVVAISGSISPVSSTLYYPALVTMQYALHTTATAMNASLSIFTFFTAFFPLVWATFGDRFGRRRIYIISFFIALLGSICCALSVNAEMFIVFRAFSAIGSSSAMSMGAGTIADIFEPHERGKAFAYYTCGPLLGPAIGPIVGGYLNQGLGWRSNFWFLSIFILFLWLGILFLLPETWRATEKVSNDSEDQKTKKRNFVNPVGALKLLLYPNIALTVAFTSILFFALYLNNTTFTRTYTLQYGFDSGIVGICYLPNAAGSMLGGILGGRMSDKVYNKSLNKAKANNQEIYPEMRLGSFLFYSMILLQLVAFIAYGWCLEKNVHFAYGLVCQFFIGFALMFPNVTLNAYMVDCFRKQGASVTACNNFARYIMAGIGSLISTDINNAMGSGVLFTFCGALLLIFSFGLIIVKKYTHKWAALRANQAA
ncbi:major facilitator superfamily domain-containing protein [Gilbertella persicaria]|uniref:major facilitator superfamily domain-containing protein n=1 Tax=Gilbertella persicaria TaxID=101096 RepID=UPI0022205CBA|nr:major facilitator superfamily domain-containing protein [Gilbertella persicaria]KAI8078060.1 major facilitator superfamily domain-containing protein [Gilbertella persicaria]